MKKRNRKFRYYSKMIWNEKTIIYKILDSHKVNEEIIINIRNKINIKMYRLTEKLKSLNIFPFLKN